MRWRGRRQSTHVEDRRGVRAGAKLAGGGLGLLLLVGLGLFLGVDPRTLMQVVQTQQEGAATLPDSRTELEDEQAQFVAVVLADTEDTWNELFRRAGRHYREPTLVLFSGAVESACGFAQAAVGPFYCPADQKVYIDCFAGIWAHHADRTRALLERGDIEEGLDAATAIGDDRLQKESQGYVVPESFTHGSSRNNA